MIRLNITVEGQTEEGFVHKVLEPCLSAMGIYPAVRCVLTSRDRRPYREYRGGLRNYEKARGDILNWIREDRNSECRFTTMFDLYKLPNNFPGYADAMRISSPYDRVRKLEECLKEDINDPRFIPYIQLHEFEALIFTDPAELACEYLENADGITNLCRLAQTQNPEEINGGENTAPSKRIIAEIPEYDKTFAGPLVTSKIGLQKMRQKCPHFALWLDTLENLVAAGT